MGRMRGRRKNHQVAMPSMKRRWQAKAIPVVCMQKPPSDW